MLGSSASPGLKSLAGQRPPASPAAASATPAKPDDTGKPAATQEKGSFKLSAEALSQIATLKARDSSVRQHEAAHLAAAGGMATSGASYTYQKGPDGVAYAIGGEVGINMSPGHTPQETIDRASTIRAAALAPADPSGQDLAVAAMARQMEFQARGELVKQNQANAQAALDSGSALSRTYGTKENGQRNSLSVFA